MSERGAEKDHVRQDGVNSDVVEVAIGQARLCSHFNIDQSEDLSQSRVAAIAIPAAYDVAVLL